MSNTNNPSAFPSTNHGMIISTGMGLRDYFAAKAMQGLTTTLDQTDEEPLWTVIATDSYKLADAMLKARET
jgi:hypothetical protein